MSESLSGRSRASMDTAAVAPGWGEPSGATLCVRRGTGECHQRLVQSWKATKKKSKSAVSNLLGAPRNQTGSITGMKRITLDMKRSQGTQSEPRIRVFD